MNSPVTPATTIYPDAYFPTGMTGTLGVRVRRRSDQVDVVARTTSGIVESPAGSGFYVATLTAPSTIGDYEVFWDDGTIGPGHVAAEDFSVAYTAAGTPTPAAGDLLTVAELKERLRSIKSTDTSKDSLLQRLVTNASRATARYTNHRFGVETAAAKTFRYDGDEFLSLSPWDLQAATAAAATIQIDTDIAATTVSTGLYRFEPRHAPNGVYETVLLAGYTLPPIRGSFWQANDWPGSLGVFGRQVTVTGDWGWTSIPESLKEGALQLAAMWYGNPRATSRADLGSLGEQWSIGMKGTVSIPEMITELWQPFVRVEVL